MLEYKRELDAIEDKILRETDAYENGARMVLAHLDQAMQKANEEQINLAYVHARIQNMRKILWKEE